MSQATYDRCRALTDDGERCSRPAQDGAFCFQHDENDPTVDEETGDASSEATDGGAETERAHADDSSTGENEEAESSDDAATEVGRIRETVQSVGGEAIGRSIEGVVGMTRNDSGWQVTVEVVERSSVPDTQDIIGQYEIDLESDHAVTGYRRVDRYRRGDTQREDYVG